MHSTTDIAGVRERVRALAEPLVRQAGLELFDVEYKPDRGRMVVRIFLQRPGGRVGLDELTAMSRQLGDVFDAHDAVPGRYHLECSSPGLERALRHEAHFRGAVGERVAVRVREPIAERRLLKGTLRAVGTTGISVDDGEVGLVEVPFGMINEARTEFVSGQKGVAGSRS
ncbi:MAG TPA: ribosome maturation factor RimP [Candidatus Limnocylindria bacterium]|nr:ribosome maturation factor RimP [Candidatus Limnocylindria bacterium]